MNDWARRRKRIIFLIFWGGVVVVFGIPSFLIFYKSPTCFDGKMNGDEAEVDCGGSCQLLCRAESLPIIARGDARVLTIAPNVYEVVAVFENPNTQAEIYKAGYTFKLYDARSATIPVKTIEGETYIPRARKFAVFEGPFNIEEEIVPTRATFEWNVASLVWQKDGWQYPELRIKETVLSREATNPRLDAKIENTSLENAANIDLTALISDENGNIFAASKTFLDSLAKGAGAPIVFTWPRPFPASVADIEIIIRIFPDRTFIQ